MGYKDKATKLAHYRARYARVGRADRGGLPQPQPYQSLTPAEIVTARQALGLTQEGFARAIGRASNSPDIAGGTVSRWERGVLSVGPKYGPALWRLVRKARKESKE